MLTRFGHYIKRGQGQATFNGVAILATGIAIFYIVKRLRSSDALSIPWARLLESSTYCRAILYLIFITLIGGIALGVTKLGYIIRLFICLAVMAHAIAYSSPSLPDRINLMAHRLRLVDRILFILCILLIITELCLRVIPRFYPTPFIVNPQLSGSRKLITQRFPPYFVHEGFTCNTGGYFDAEFSRDKKSGVKRIVVIGDNFAVGDVPYEENFIALLEKSLDARDGKERVELYNMGVWGADSRDYGVIFENEGQHYKPDEVIVCLFVGNDFVAPPKPRSRMKIYPEDLAIALTARRLIELVGHKRGKTYTCKHTIKKPETREQKALDAEGRFMIMQYAREEYFPHLCTWTFESLERIKELADGKMTLVIIPNEFQVTPALLNKIASSEDKIPEIDLIQRHLSAFCVDSGIKCIDLLPALQHAETEEGPTYYPDEPIWNSRGNRIAAEAIAEGMLEKPLCQ